ncbi:MAG: DUF2953 domain-containing protein [Desulfitobacteriaceae bacterium]
MRILALFLAGLIWLLISLAIKAVVDFRYTRSDEQDHLVISIKALHGLWKFSITLPALQLEWDEGPQLEIDQKTKSGTGSIHKAKQRVRFRFWRLGFLYRLWPGIPRILSKLQKIKYYFYRGIHCTSLNWHFEIGLRDPVQTALVVGSLWAILGSSLARFYRQVTMDTDHPQLQIIPQFQKPGFSCEINCIFNLRMGHIIIAGLKLLRIFQGMRRG